MSLTSVDETVAEEPFVVPPLVTSLQCPECGGWYSGPTGLGVHRSIRHGVPGKTHPGSRGKKRRRSPTRMPTKAAEYEAGLDVPDPEEIIQTVTQMIWPNGVPPEAMPGLLRWYTQTAEFLKSVRYP